MSFCRRSTYGQKLLFLINFWKCQMIENVQYVNANRFNVKLILCDLRKCQLVECNFFHFGLNCNSTS
jgi:hypothetical protein